MRNKILNIWFFVVILALFVVFGKFTSVFADKKISAGGAHSLVLESDNTVWSCGANYFGQLGDGTTSNKHVPAQINDFNDVATISGGGSHNLSVKSDKSIWVWGYNYQGQLGDGTKSEKTHPEQITLTDVFTVASGEYHSLAVKTDGTVWAWGYNGNGQLGTDTTTAIINTPFQVNNIADTVAAAAGDHHSLALKSDGTVWAWGYNAFGQLGNGFTTTSITPVQVSGLSSVTAITSGGYFSLALKSDGTIWAWGNNDRGQLGNGTNNTSATPIQVADLSSVIAIASGKFHGMALKSDGTVWAWGCNDNGQLGNESNSDSLTPIQANRLTNVVAIDGGGFHSLAIKSDDTIWAWGDNDYGQLGDGSTSDKNTPVQMHIGNFVPEPEPTPTPDVKIEPPEVKTRHASDIETNQAMLNGWVKGNGTNTTTWFQYGMSSGSYNSTTSVQTVSGSGNTDVSATVNNLQPNTTYYYTIVAENEAESAYGEELSFTTKSDSVPIPTPETKPTPEPKPTPTPETKPTPTPEVEPTPEIKPTPTPEATPPPDNEGVLYGYTMDENNKPVKFCWIKLTGIETEFTSKVRTDANGFFQFEGLENDSYILIAEKSGYRKTGKIVDFYGEDVEVEFVLKKKK